MHITISDRALSQLEERTLWWREHRPDSAVDVPTAFRQATAMLLELPRLGKVYRPDPRYRTYALKGTPYRLFYILDESRSEIQIDAVWSAMRGKGPPL